MKSDVFLKEMGPFEFYKYLKYGFVRTKEIQLNQECRFCAAIKGFRIQRNFHKSLQTYGKDEFEVSGTAGQKLFH